VKDPRFLLAPAGKPAPGIAEFTSDRDRALKGKYGGRFLAFLKQLKQSACRSGRRVVLLLDNARYHHGKLHKDWRALHCKQFQLDYLPPYSPELNPIERLWKLTRRKCLHNVHFEELSEVTDAVENQFAIWTNPQSTLAPIMRNYLRRCV
jgi:transposase